MIRSNPKGGVSNEAMLDFYFTSLRLCALALKRELQRKGAMIQSNHHLLPRPLWIMNWIGIGVLLLSILLHIID